MGDFLENLLGELDKDETGEEVQRKEGPSPPTPPEKERKEEEKEESEEEREEGEEGERPEETEEGTKEEITEKEEAKGDLEEEGEEEAKEEEVGEEEPSSAPPGPEEDTDSRERMTLEALEKEKERLEEKERKKAEKKEIEKKPVTLEDLRGYRDFFIVLNIALIVVILLQLVFYKELFVQNFMIYNLLPLLTISIGVVVGFIFLATDYTTLKSFPKKIILVAGIILIILALSSLLFARQGGIQGFSLGLIGVIGLVLVSIGREEGTLMDSVPLMFFVLGVFLIIFVPVNLAFQAFDLYVDSSVEVFGISMAFPTLLGALLILFGFILLLRRRGEGTTTSGYVSIWLFGMVSLLLAPFHEVIGLNASGNYGIYDRTLYVGGTICVVVSFALFLRRKTEDASVDNLLLKGNLKQRDGRIEDAIKVYDEALHIDPTSEIAWTNKGVALRRLGEYEEALECFEEALDIDDSYEDAWIGRGNVLLKLRRHEEAMLSYNSVLKLDRNNEVALVNKGALLAMLGRYEEAIKSFDKALKINPMYVDALAGKGRVLRRQARYDEEMACYDQALQIDPTNEAIWNAKGNALVNRERYEDALDCFDEVLRINPSDSGAWNNKGKILSTLESEEEALECFEQAIELNNRDEVVWSNLAKSLSNLDRNDEAIKSINRAIQLNPYYSVSWYYKGDIFAAMGKYGDAIKCYDTALDISPEFSMVYVAKAYALDKVGDIEGAEQCRRKAVELQDAARKKVSLRRTEEEEPPVLPLEKVEEKKPEEIVPAAAVAAAAPEPAVVAPSAADEAMRATKETKRREDERLAVMKAMEKKLERGYNYLILEERTDKAFEALKEMIEDDTAGLCITTTFPGKVRKIYGLKKATIAWMSGTASDEVEVLNPKRLDFEIARKIGAFIKNNVESVILLDGFEYLVLENGFEEVMKFLKKINDMASVNDGTFMVSTNPNAFSKEDITVLRKEFDRVMDEMGDG